MTSLLVFVLFRSNMEAFNHRINTHFESWLGPRGKSLSSVSFKLGPVPPLQTIPANSVARSHHSRKCTFVSRSAGARLVAAGPLPSNLCADSPLSPDRVDGAQVHEAQAAVLLPRCHDDLQPGPHAAVLLHVLRGKRRSQALLL